MNFSIRFSLLLLQATLLFFFTIQCKTEIKTPEKHQIESVSYLALGDSYTIGTGIDAKNSWPIQLSKGLQQKGITIDTTHIIATNGWTTTDLKNGIAEEKPDSTYHMVSLLIGVNNQYQELEVDLYKKEFRELVEQAIAFASSDTSRVFVVSIPNYGVTPFAQYRNPEKITEEITIYNEIAKNISSDYGVPFVNITPISEHAAKNEKLLASDNLHPSAKMYALWVEEKIIPEAVNILQP